MDKKLMPQLGDNLTRLGYGCMRFPKHEDGTMNMEEAIRLIKKGYELGINYFDTAVVYHGGDSEKALGEAMKDFERSTFYLADKMTSSAFQDEESMKALFFKQLETLHTDYIDYYLVHSVNRNNWQKYKDCHVVEFLNEMRAQGKIRHLGFSFHDTEPLLKEVVASNKWDFVQLQLNYLDWKAMHADRLYQVLVDNNLPCMVMEPVRGGYLANLNDEFNAKLKALDPDASIASWAVRFVSGLANVAVVLSGMTLDDQLEDNVKTLGNFKPLSEKELSVLDEITEELCKLNDIPCTGCRYCMDCPKGVDIPEVFNVYAQWRVFGNSQRFVNSYENALNHNKGAVNCVKCGLCAKQCPQHIDIPNQLARVHSLYLEEKAKLEAEKAAAEA